MDWVLIGISGALVVGMLVFAYALCRAARIGDETMRDAFKRLNRRDQ